MLDNFEIACPLPHNFVETTETNISKFLFDKFKEFPDNLALTNEETGETFTYARLIQCCIETRNVMEKFNFCPNDKVAIISRNCPEYLILQLAFASLGCVGVDINTNSIRGEIPQMFRQSDVKLVICQRILLDKLKDNTIGKVFILEEIMQNLPQSGVDQKSHEMTPHQDATDHFLMQFSSGTTGFPKSAIVSHKARINNILQMSCAGFGVPTIGDTTLLVLPIYHSYANTMAFVALYNGSHIVTVPKFKRSTFVEILRKYQITHLPLVPPIAHFLADDQTLARCGNLKLKNITSGAATISSAVLEKLQKRLEIDYVGQLYGMTEIHVATYTPNKVQNWRSLGTPIPGVFCKVINVETGKSLGPNEAGELCIKSPGTNPGYYKNSRATAELIDEHGWYHTGDLMYYDPHCFFYYVNRLKEIIKFNGIQVSPIELETIILRHPSVNDCVVFGIPHAKYGEVPTALVVLKTYAEVTETDLQQLVAANVAHYKQLRGGVHFTSEIPRSPAGKIARNKLKELVNASKL